MLNKYNWLTKEILEKDYTELGNFKLISEKYNIPRSTIERYCKVWGVKTIPKINYTCDDNIFSGDNEKSFYLAGFIAADGSINQNKCDEPNYLSINLSRKDEQYLSRVKELLQFTGPIKYSIKKMSEINENWNDAEQCKIDIYSKQIIVDLSRFGIGPRKSLVYKMPEWLINHPLILHFVRGYNDGDGSFYYTDEKWFAKKSNTTKYFRKFHCSIRGTEEFLLQVRDIINNSLRNKSNAIPRLNGGIYQLHFSGTPLTSNIAKCIYENANIFMDRKYDVVKELL